MSILQYLENIKIVQKSILDYIENEEKIEENYKNLDKIITNIQIRNNRQELKLLFHLIVKIANNHRRTKRFFNELEKILLLFKIEMKRFFSNLEIFNIFKSNKRILLFLFETKLLSLDSEIAKLMQTPKYAQAKYPQYFYSEIKPFITAEMNQSILLEIKDPNKHDINRKLGENENIICHFIRNDKDQDFHKYCLRTQTPLDSQIPSSIYETNPLFLKRKNPTFLEYASFYGSLGVFKKLVDNNVKVQSSIWIYSIHAFNPELVGLLKYNKIPIEDRTYKMYFKESIKCHHSEITKFFRENFESNIPEIQWFIFTQALKYYNFGLIGSTQLRQPSFFHLCHYDYISFVDILLKEMPIDVNAVVIFNDHFFFK